MIGWRIRHILVVALWCLVDGGAGVFVLKGCWQQRLSQSRWKEKGLPEGGGLFFDPVGLLSDAFGVDVDGEPFFAFVYSLR